MLSKVNYSMDIVKRIKANEPFTQAEKEKILTDFVGMSEDNNSYFTPFEICEFIYKLLDIKNGKVADLSAGIGNMVKPMIKTYGELEGNVEVDLYEYDENNSVASEMAWSDFAQVNTYGSFDSIDRNDEIGEYDFIIGNPPFSGSVPYWCQWNHAKNGKAKKNNICDAFVDLAIRKTKDKGYIALVLPYGHLYKGNATEKLREWMKDEVALKGIFPLDSNTFKQAGLSGTSVSTVLCVWQKGVKQDKVFFGELDDKDELTKELDALAYHFHLFNSEYYDISYASDHVCGLCAYMEEVGT